MGSRLGQLQGDQKVTDEPLHTKWRPRKFDEVMGHGAQIKALKSNLGKSRAFMFTGPAGTGKTTLARLAAKHVGATNLMEIDAASKTGVDDMRQVQEVIRYKPLMGDKTAVIVDEAHRLSAQAWDSLLKSVEEPPAHVIWFFCTTNPNKIPKTIQTRCTPIGLKPLSNAELTDLVEEIAHEEKIQLPAGVGSLIVREADGSARQALVNLETCRNVKDRAEAADLLRRSLESDATRELCQLLLKGGTWKQAMAIMEQLDGQEPEGIRIVVCRYFAAVLKNAKDDKAARRGLEILAEFEKPYFAAEGNAPLYLSIGRCLFA